MAIVGGGSWMKHFCWTFLVLSAILGADSTDIPGVETYVTTYRVMSLVGVEVRDGLVVLTAGEAVPVRLFGQGFTDQTKVSFTSNVADRGSDCTDLGKTDPFTVTPADNSSSVGTTQLVMPASYIAFDHLMMCVRGEGDGAMWVHQGDLPWLRIKVKAPEKRSTYLPIPLQVILIAILLVFSGLFSGLNLGLMSLDKTELAIVENCGTETEKSHAKKIFPLRKRGNFLLCTILLGNVMVNNTLTIFMDDLSGSGAIAVIVSTLGIVIFGEIIPQAVCSRHGLAVGAHTIWITKFFMLLTFPLSFPISKVLDCVLGEEVGAVYNRDRLRELLKVTEENMDLVKDEVHIIAGALELSKKTVKDVMTTIDDVYMIEYNGMLDFDTMNEIMKTGYTRVPVYEGEKSNIIALLNIKDLAFVDPDDKTPLATVCKFYNHPVNTVFEDTKLDVMLEEFKKGRSHMSFVQRVNNEGEGDPFYEVLGVVTLEDVIEEILQAEIVDETDTITDNKARRRRIAQTKDFSVFNKPDEQNQVRMSPQLTLATFQYLSTSVPPFKPELISETVLQRILQQNVVVSHKFVDPKADDNFLYRRGRPCDYFILIVQGRVEIDIGQEQMIFEGGPFIFFGVQALAGIAPTLSHEPSYSSLDSASELYNKTVTFTPDCTVKAVSDLQYIKIRRAFYLAAYRASLMESRTRTDTGSELSEDPFTREWMRAKSVAPDPVPAFNIDSPEEFTAGDAGEDEPLVTERSNDSRVMKDGGIPDRTIDVNGDVVEKSESEVPETPSKKPSVVNDVNHQDITIDIDDVKMGKDVRNNVQAANADPSV